MAKKLQTQPYDAAAYLKTEQDCAPYLQAAIDESDGDPAIVIAALGDIARARGMMQLARETGLTREGLYKALSPRQSKFCDSHEGLQGAGIEAAH